MRALSARTAAVEPEGRIVSDGGDGTVFLRKTSGREHNNNSSVARDLRPEICRAHSKTFWYSRHQSFSVIAYRTFKLIISRIPSNANERRTMYLRAAVCDRISSDGGCSIFPFRSKMAHNHHTATEPLRPPLSIQYHYVPVARLYANKDKLDTSRISSWRRHAARREGAPLSLSNRNGAMISKKSAVFLSGLLCLPV